MLKKKRITVIGAGFSGTLTAIRLLQFGDSPLEICLLERDEEFRYGGIAYGQVSTTWNHMLNIQAGRITLYREYPEDFLVWVNDSADRSEWPSKWKYHTFGVSCAVPRRIFSQYLKERLQEATEYAHPAVSLMELKGESIDIITEADGCVVKYIANDAIDTGIQALWSDQVVISTGHLEPLDQSFFAGIKDSDRLIFNPYSRRGKSAFQQVKSDEKILIVGTALSSFDAVVSLLNSGHDGPIEICSRHGHTHATYPSDHQHDIVSVRRPPFLDKEHLCANTVVQGIKEEYAYLFDMFKNQYRVADQVIPERILKGWEPYIVELVLRMDPKDIQFLFNKYKSLIVTSRTSTVPAIGDVVRNRMNGFNGAEKKISILATSISAMYLVDEEKKVCVSFSDGRESLIVDRVINCLGHNADYNRTKITLWHNLIQERKYAQPHQKTGRGIEVNQHGQIISPIGKPSDRLFCVGPMRQGDEIARRGRVGAFVFSIGTLRNQCFDTALAVLRQIRHKKNIGIMNAPESGHVCWKSGLNWLFEEAKLGLVAEKEKNLKDLTREYSQSSFENLYHNYLRTPKYAEREHHQRAIAAGMEDLCVLLAKQFKLDIEKVNRFTALLDILLEKRVVFAMCDVSKLAKWETPEYAEKVTTLAGAAYKAGVIPDSMMHSKDEITEYANDKRAMKSNDKKMVAPAMYSEMV